MSIERIRSMLELCSGDKTLFPPTDLYNEGWMLRLCLDWFSNNAARNHPLAISKKVKWYSEALLPSAFLARYRGDKFAESWTHADGVIGNFMIGKEGAGDLFLFPDAKHFVVIEAKMFSKLSSGVTNARYYNQAARNVGCIAEVLKRSKQNPSNLTRLGFYVVAPQVQINDDVFIRHMTHGSIKKIVKRRVDEYDGSKENWYRNWFLPTINQIDIRTISWEEIISYIIQIDPSSGNNLNDFYRLSLRFNQTHIRC